MEVSVQVTNQECYDQLVRKVEYDSLKAESSEVFTGAIQVLLKDGSIVPFFGLIEAHDFEKRFGFVLTVSKRASILSL